MRCDLPADLRPVGDFLDNLLYSPGTDRETVVEGEPRFQERPYPKRHGDSAPLGLLAVRTPLSLYPDLALLPLDTLCRHAAELRDAEAGIEKRPDDQLLLRRPAGVAEEIRFLAPQGLPDVAVPAAGLLPDFLTGMGSCLFWHCEFDSFSVKRA